MKFRFRKYATAPAHGRGEEGNSAAAAENANSEDDSPVVRTKTKARTGTPVVLLLYFFSSELFFVICSKLSLCYSYTEFYERSVQNLWEDIGQFQCKLQRLNFKCTGTSSCYAIVCPNTKKVVLIFV